MEYFIAHASEARALLSEIGEALYGPHWRTEMARALGVNQRTIRRWEASAFPTVYTVGLEALIRGRQLRLTTLLARIDQYAARQVSRRRIKIAPPDDDDC